MPVPRHYVYPVCGVPGNYLQRVYGNEHCSEYYEPCSADDWRDKETGHLYDEQTNRAHCMQMCSDAGWEGCVYTHGGCNDPSKLTFLECQGMWDHDQDGGFAGTNACHTSPGFSELNDHLNDATKAAIVIREINHVIGLLLEKLTADSAATFVANYFDSMTQTCLELSGAEPVRGVRA